MGDKRTDSGQFYPGGKTIPRQPVRPGGGSDVDAVHYYAETKTASEKAQACANIGAMPADTPIPSVTGKLPMKPLPKYLHALCFDDTYPADAAWLYAQLGPSDLGRCSAVRRGGKLWRNYDWTFDDAAEFVVRTVAASATGASQSRFASVGVASVGSRLTENDVMSGVYSRYYKCLPGMTLDGINEKGVVCEINVDGGPKTGWHGDAKDDGIHILAAVRWALDHGTSAQMAAEWIADNIIQPTGEMNFHFMVADANATYIVENGIAYDATNDEIRQAMTNFPILPDEFYGEGLERYWEVLRAGLPITDAWFTRAYGDGTFWPSDFGGGDNVYIAKAEWAAQGTDKEAHRGKTTSSGKAWWQSVHTTEYDFAAKTMKVAVQETDEWFTFAVDAHTPQIEFDAIPTEGSLKAARSGGIWSWVTGLISPITAAISSLTSSVSGLASSKVDTQFTETIPAGAYTFTNGKNGFQAWAWKDASDEWHCVCVNKPDELIGPQIPGMIGSRASFSHIDDLTYGDIRFYGAEWVSESPLGDTYFDGPIVEAVIDAPITITSFLDNLGTPAARAKIADAIPVPIAPSTAASASGKAADAKATGDALAVKLDTKEFKRRTAAPYNPNIEYSVGDCVIQEDEVGDVLLHGYRFAKTDVYPVYGPGGAESTLPATAAGNEYWSDLERIVEYIYPQPPNIVMSDEFERETGKKLDRRAAVPPFVAKTSGSYEAGEIVLRDGIAYTRNLTAGADTSWNADHWTLADNAYLAARLKNLKSNGNATDAFATDLLGKPEAITAVQNIVNNMFDNGDTTAYPRTTGED